MSEELAVFNGAAMKQHLKLIERCAWRAVSDSHPMPRVVSLLAFEDGGTWIGYYDHGLWFYPDDDPIPGTVTHWLPIPPHPAIGL
jgi:hypothetical protein